MDRFPVAEALRQVAPRPQFEIGREPLRPCVMATFPRVRARPFAFVRPTAAQGAPRASVVKPARRAPPAAARSGLDGAARCYPVGQGRRRGTAARAGAVRIVAFAADHQFPGDARGLVSERHGGELGRFAGEDVDEPGRGTAAPTPHLLDDRRGPDHHQAAQGLAPARVMAPSRRLPPVECSFGVSPIHAQNPDRSETRADR
jgi:hypothetical protein